MLCRKLQKQIFNVSSWFNIHYMMVLFDILTQKFQSNSSSVSTAFLSNSITFVSFPLLFREKKRILFKNKIKNLVRMICLTLIKLFNRDSRYEGSCRDKLKPVVHCDSDGFIKSMLCGIVSEKKLKNVCGQNFKHL